MLEQRDVTRDPTYWLTRDEAEARRLILQARMFDPFMRTAMERAGIGEGMTVLDVGTGAGDVAMLAANLVGPRGRVLAVDLDARAIELARARALAAGMTNIEFIVGDCRTVALPRRIDAIVGRLVLMYVADPAATVRMLADRLESGGIVLFQECNVTPVSVQSHPPLELMARLSAWTRAAATHAGLNQAQGYDLRSVFIQAGLPEPQMQLDSSVGGGPDWEGYEYLEATLRSMLPLVICSGEATAEEIDIDTVAARLRNEAIANDAVIKGPDMVSAWARKP